MSYLRQVEHREIKFLIEERELTDEAAFRLADIENRSRLDISDYERALDYREAVESFYGGVARRSLNERPSFSPTDHRRRPARWRHGGACGRPGDCI